MDIYYFIPMDVNSLQFGLTVNEWKVIPPIQYIVRLNVYFPPGPLETFNLDVLVSLLRQENAVDICVIKVTEQIQYAQHFIVVSGVSPRHLRAMALYAIKVVNMAFSFGISNICSL